MTIRRFQDLPEPEKLSDVDQLLLSDWSDGYRPKRISLQALKQFLNSSTGGSGGGNGTPSLPLGVEAGGTGQQSLPEGQILIGNGTNPMQALAPGNDNFILISQGGNWVFGDLAQFVGSIVDAALASHLQANDPHNTRTASGGGSTAGGWTYVESERLDYSNSSRLIWPHGRSSQPALFGATLENKQSRYTFSPGDRISVSTVERANNRGVSVSATETDVVVHVAGGIDISVQQNAFNTKTVVTNYWGLRVWAIFFD